MDKCCKAKGNVNGNEFSSSEMDESWKENQNDDYDCPFVITKVESLADFSKCEQSTPTLKDDILQGLHGQDVGISVSPSPLSAHDFQMCTTTPSRREGVRLLKCEPVLVVHGNGAVMKHLMFSTTIPSSEEVKKEVEDVGCQRSKEDTDEWPSPCLPLRCIVALAIMNSERGELKATEIYQFMTEHFLIFSRQGPWRGDVRSCLRTKYFAKVTELEGESRQRHISQWIINPLMGKALEKDLRVNVETNRAQIRRAMSDPDNLEFILSRAFRKREHILEQSMDSTNDHPPCLPEQP